jgi:hypothetical protein
MTGSSDEQPYGEREIRCPKLGGQVTFEYCRIEEQGRPCRRAIKCWTEYFDAEELFRDKLGTEECLNWFGQPPQPKVVTLVELIEKARKVLEEKKDE